MKTDKRFVAGLILAAALYWIVGGYTGRALLITAVLLLIAAVLQSIMNTALIKVSLLENEGRIEVGDDASLTVEAVNRGLFLAPHVVTHVLKTGEKRAVSIKGRSKNTLSYGFTPIVRGTVDVGVINTEISDTLNIITVTKSLEPSMIRVYPKITREREENLIYQTMGEGEYYRTFSRENSYITREHRKYRPGDSLRRINWKVSAKTGDLMVKQGESMEDRDIMIVLNMHGSVLAMDEKGIYENTLVTDALSLSHGLMGRRLSHGFMLTGPEKKYFFIDSEEKFQDLEEELTDIKAEGPWSLKNFCEEESEDLLDRGTLIFVTKPDLSDFKAVERLKNLHNEVTVMAPHLEKSGYDFLESRLQFIELRGDGYDVAEEQLN